MSSMKFTESLTIVIVSPWIVFIITGIVHSIRRQTLLLQSIHRFGTFCVLWTLVFLAIMFIGNLFYLQ